MNFTDRANAHFDRSQQLRWVGCLCGILSFLGLGAIPLSLRAQSDNYNDGNDTGWSRYSPLSILGVPGVFSFPSGGYRIQTQVPTGNPNNPPRAGSLRQDVTYTNFYVAVDLVNWKDDTRQAFGLLARIGTPGLAATTGYAFTYERGTDVNATSGGTDISKITGEAPDGLKSESVHLDPAKDYRFVFIGNDSFSGINLEGRIYELPDTVTPIHTILAIDSTPYPSGFCGLVVYDNSGGGGVCDATFDNYFATDIEPPRLSILDQGFNSVRISWPASATGFKLQSSPVLPATTWTDYPEPPNDEGGVFVITLDPSPSNAFYRLARP